MDLYLVRHAVAADAAPGQPDLERPLTRDGSDRFARQVEGLKRLGIRFDRMLHSPALRAVETARLLQPLLTGTSSASARLIEAPGPELLAELRGKYVGVVGHEPWLSELAAWLAIGQAGFARALELDKGAVLWLAGDLRPGAMAVRALYPPEALLQIAD